MPLENRSIALTGLEGVAPTASLIRAEVRDGIGQITEIDIEFILVSPEDGPPATPMDCEAALGLMLSVSIEMDPAPSTDTSGREPPKRWFNGICIEICRQDDYGGSPLYFASLRAWPWLLTQTTDCRIFRESSDTINARSIIETVHRELIANESYAVEFRLLSNEVQRLPERALRVQYRESAYEFLYRLMADDGLNFFMKHEEGRQTMVVFNGLSKLPYAPGTSTETPDATVEFVWYSQLLATHANVLYELHRTSHLWSGRVSLGDYEPESARIRLEATATAVSPMNGAQAYAKYDYPGRFVRRNGKADRDHHGDHLASVSLDRLKAGARLDHAAGNARRIASGHKFRFGPGANLAPGTYHVVLRAVHRLQIDAEGAEEDLRNSLLVRRASLPPLTLKADLAEGETLERYRVDLDLVRAGVTDEVMHVPLPEPARPVIPGLQTATVVGPLQGRVHTDTLGRVKVRFHWDRHSPNAANTSCWVRTVMPWTGNQFGAVMLPRVGQEVVVLFEEGDPDRPIVAGMLYNSVNAVPSASIDPATSIGIVSASFSGNQRDPNMLILDDSDHAERMVIQAHRDFHQSAGKDMKTKVGDTLTVNVGKTMTLKADKVEIEAKKKISISVGKSLIEITDSEIVLKADKIRNNP